MNSTDFARPPCRHPAGTRLNVCLKINKVRVACQFCFTTPRIPPQLIINTSPSDASTLSCQLRAKQSTQLRHLVSFLYYCYRLLHLRVLRNKEHLLLILTKLHGSSVQLKAKSILSQIKERVTGVKGTHQITIATCKSRFEGIFLESSNQCTLTKLFGRNSIV